MQKQQPDDAMIAARLVAILLFLPMAGTAVAVFNVGLSFVSDALLALFIISAPKHYRQITQNIPFYVQAATFLTLYLVGSWIGFSTGMGLWLLFTALGMM